MAERRVFPDFVGSNPPSWENEHLVVARAPEVPWNIAEKAWDSRKEYDRKMEINQNNFQVAVLPAMNGGDFSTKFYHDLVERPIGNLQPACVYRDRWPDFEPNLRAEGEKKVDVVYLVGSVLREQDLFRVIAAGDHYKNTLGVKKVVMVTPFFGLGRGDKNVDRAGDYESRLITRRPATKALASFVDVWYEYEPHSSASQYFAMKEGIIFVPVSPWKIMANEVKNESKFKTERIVLSRPDIGRTISSTRMGNWLAIDQIWFNKTRLSGTDVALLDLSDEHQKLIEGSIMIVYDDEASTFGTINRVAAAGKIYGAKELWIYLSHRKFTGNWRDNLNHPLITKVVATDSREPIGLIGMQNRIREMGIGDMVREIIEADVKGVNPWKDPEYKELIIQWQPEENRGSG